VPLPHLFDYQVPSGMAAIEPGVRVLVPFGRRKSVGIVIRHSDKSDVPLTKLLEVHEVLDQDGPLLDGPLIELLCWCWNYYKHAPGEVVASALPPALRKAKGVVPGPPSSFRLTAAGREQLEQPKGRAPVQLEMLNELADGPLGPGGLAGIGSQWRKTLCAVMDKGWVVEEAAHQAKPEFAPGPELVPDQRKAVDSISASLARFGCHLLDGVTGSGKTEVYMSLLEDVIAGGRQGLVLVPEIGLTPQLIRRFRNRLGLDPAIIHSGIGAGARLESWSAARSGRARLVVGTRSALFTPLPEPGIIILDEEHDASFKQQDGFRYSARDVAVKRASDLGIPVVLGSATPSLETLSNAAQGKYSWHRLRERATRTPLPSWRVLDMRQQAAVSGLSVAALDAIAETLDRGEQVMIFLNRRGYAPVLMCQQCGWSGNCARCDSHLTWHRNARKLICHHCGSQRPAPQFCPDCQADALMGAGEGTQQLEEFLEKKFEKVPVLRFDRDRTSRAGVMDKQLEQVRNGEPCLLVGTQMLAKGHHFPGVTLVVIVNVDQALYSADFRSLERMGQMILQVAGRAGRMEKSGTVVLQTLHPEHAALELLLTRGYEAYARWLLEERQAAGLPPAGYQALLRAEAHDRSIAEQFLNDAVGVFPRGETRVYGPMPAIMERVGGRSRMYLVVQGPVRAALHRQVDQWLPVLRKLPSARKVRWAVDIDPQNL
jgi:primosomal protein N' (replication factor Y)